MIESGKRECFSAADEEMTSALQSALEEAAASQKCRFASDKSQTSLVLEQLRKEKSARLVLGFGCGTEQNQTGVRAGFVVVLQEQLREAKDQKASQRLKQLQAELPAWLDQWQLCRRGIQSRRLSQLVKFWRHRQGALIATGLAVLFLAMFVPIPYRPQRECVAEPAIRSFVASLVAGRLKTSFVRPGDYVEKGQLLAKIDDEQLRLELSAAQTELAAAQKRRASALATRAG